MRNRRPEGWQNGRIVLPKGDLGRSARPCHQLPDILPKTAAIECIELVLAKLGIRLDDKVINFASRLCHRLPNYRNR